MDETTQGLKISEHFSAITIDGRNYGFVGSTIKTWANAKNGRVVSLMAGSALSLCGAYRLDFVYVVKLDGVTIFACSPHSKTHRLARGFYKALRFCCRELAGQTYADIGNYVDFYTRVTYFGRFGVVCGLTEKSFKKPEYRQYFNHELLETVGAYSRYE